MTWASDLSAVAIERAGREARQRGLTMGTAVADLRHLSRSHGSFDLVLACDSALPHLLSDGEILQALRECWCCTAPGRGCLISARDYQVVENPVPEVRPYGVRQADGKTFVLFQVWAWDPPFYDLALCIMEDDGGDECRAQVGTRPAASS